MNSILEVSRQDVSIPLSVTHVVAPSVPLLDLAKELPASPHEYTFADHDVPFLMSNDESARCFDMTMGRVDTAEYQEATNRVAVVVGESALAAALPMIPEDTIIMIDCLDTVCGYLQSYIEALREEPNIESWKKRVIENAGKTVNPVGDLDVKLRRQAAAWAHAGYTHPADNPAAYDLSQDIARNKAIIPWHANVMDDEDMQLLGDLLRDRGGNVTFINLTSVMPYKPFVEDTSTYADAIRNLPVTPFAPILTTSMIADRNAPFQIRAFSTCQATGPFFGLDNLADAGGMLKGRNKGAAVERQYLELTSEDE